MQTYVNSYKQFSLKKKVLLPILRKLEFFQLTELKIVYLHPFLSSLPFINFFKHTFLYFGNKYLEN